MNASVFEKIVAAFDWKDLSKDITINNVTSLTSGLINHTWKLATPTNSYIIQKINTNIFSQPDFIDQNINFIGNYLQVTNPNYLFTNPLKNKSGESLLLIEGGAYRIFHFISNTRTIKVVTNELEAFEAAKTFALFTHNLINFDAKSLHITLADFHNLSKRFDQFTHAIKENNTERFTKTQSLIQSFLQHKTIVDRFEAFIHHKDVHIRVTHHDTKISNVLFDETGKGLCVIDLDTVMPGYYFSDVGDMFRTYLSPVSEEEADLDKISIRKNLFKAIENGYFNTLKNNLSSFEIDNFYLSGEILMYMQALRFLTDYLQNDMYYGKKYPDHNLVRAQNQFRLLQLYQEAIH